MAATRKLTQKRTCKRCWALEEFQSNYCSFHYPVKKVYPMPGYPSGGSVFADFIPQEPCPKPLTGKAWLLDREFYLENPQ